jgi:hypothetical protein
MGLASKTSSTGMAMKIATAMAVIFFSLRD